MNDDYNQNLIKCLFLPMGETNIKADNKLSKILKNEFGIQNKIIKGFIFNKKFLILGTQEQLHIDKKNEFKHKDVDLINFLSDNIYYGIINTKKNNTIMGKFAFKKTSYYKKYFCWIPIENKKLKKKQYNK